ncbi:GNAT family N-acetyltransferase [Streptomyces sp. NRRL F-2799]|uniref:GNAT family N-acetyltransferase n=1 Tax=Streptomyces sp. NRRL F-2799 TaxID=1463844 RepID=UPI00068F95E8|nr:hypothetical protein [Streptomyces sp. NRRL F-2799]
MPHTPEGGITGEMTVLIPATQQDLPLLADWFSDPEFVRHWGNRPLAREEVFAEYVGRRRLTVVSLLVLRAAAVGYAPPLPSRSRPPVRMSRGSTSSPR